MKAKISNFSQSFHFSEINEIHNERKEITPYFAAPE
jgi:hypothetical protein